MSIEESNKYNALPIEVRNICHPIIIKTQITQLTIEKQRLKRRYQQSMREINDHLKNLERTLR